MLGRLFLIYVPILACTAEVGGTPEWGVGELGSVGGGFIGEVLYENSL